MFKTYRNRLPLHYRKTNGWLNSNWVYSHSRANYWYYNKSLPCSRFQELRTNLSHDKTMSLWVGVGLKSVTKPHRYFPASSIRLWYVLEHMGSLLAWLLCVHTTAPPLVFYINMCAHYIQYASIITFIFCSSVLSLPLYNCSNYHCSLVITIYANINSADRTNCFCWE